ncbi:MAG TPA: alpha/beta hydrolase-fold protein [Mucilaginibacter sp.]|jgi:hypothetical protein
MKCFISILLIAAIASANAQTVKNNLVVMGKVDSVHSKILNEKRKVWIYLPAGADDSLFARKRYPVVYLLDGDGHFASVTGMIQQLSEVNGNSICPGMIVVAIPNTNRTRDLTPTNTLLDPQGKKTDDFKDSGGGEKFTEFIQKELMPHIDSAYSTAPYKILIGHSFGGLMVVNTLVNHPDMFNAYVAIDPSMWWDGKKLLNQTREVLKQKKYYGKSLFLAIANTMPMGMDTMKVRTDTSGVTAHIRSILLLKDVLKSNSADGLNFAYKYYGDDNHGSVPLIAEYDALHFLFKFYGLPNDFIPRLMDPLSKIDPAAEIEAHYASVSKQMGYKVSPPEDQINQMGYYFMGSKQFERAFAMFSLNIRNYPESFNVYDSMGDCYGTKGDKDNAIIYYNKALKLRKNPETIEKLNKLMAKK